MSSPRRKAALPAPASRAWDAGQAALVAGLRRVEGGLRRGVPAGGLRRLAPGLKASATSHFQQETSAAGPVGWSHATGRSAAPRALEAAFRVAQARLGKARGLRAAQRVHHDLCQLVRATLGHPAPCAGG